MTDISRYQLVDSRKTRFDGSHGPLVQRLLESVPEKPGRCLVLGAEDGFWGHRLNEMGWQPYRADPVMINIRESKQAHCVTAVRNLPGQLAFSADSFDMVFAHHLLEYFDKPEDILVEIARVMLSGGRLSLLLPPSLRGKKKDESRDLIHASQISLTTRLAELGFRRVEITMFHPPGSSGEAELWRLVTAEVGPPGLGPADRLRRELDGWIRNNTPLVIYGIGSHTDELFRIFPELADTRLVGFMDGSVEKQGTFYRGQTVHPPQGLAELDPEVCLISSRAYQEQIAERISRLKLPELKIYRIYREDDGPLEPGTKPIPGAAQRGEDNPDPQKHWDFPQLYQDRQDPWLVGDAGQEWYDFILNLLGRWKPEGFGRALDLGSGEGPFTARLDRLTNNTVGVELSEAAVKRARKKYPDIEFRVGDVRRLGEQDLEPESFDLTVWSDGIYYLDRSEIDLALDDIYSLCAPDGFFLFCAWAPGGRTYYTHEEHLGIIQDRFHVLFHRLLPSRHSVVLARPKHLSVALTLDYETWHPNLPFDRLTDSPAVGWDDVLFRPVDNLLDIADGIGVPLNFMVEVAELLALRAEEPDTARKMEKQILSIAERGHRIELHLHPSWLPETGVKYDPKNKSWSWNPRYTRLHDYPGDLQELFQRLAGVLVDIVKPVDPEYQPVAFRAACYQIQPHRPIFDALQKAGIRIDTSVLSGDSHSGYGYDFSGAPADGLPYYPDPEDINRPTDRENIVECPIYSEHKLPFNLDVRTGDELRRFIRTHPSGDGLMTAIGHPKDQPNPETFSGFLSYLKANPAVQTVTFADWLKDHDAAGQWMADEK
jgi:SAM-dependent methyltransferase